MSILLEKKMNILILENFQIFYTEKQKSVSELARKSLKTTLLGECSGGGAASEAAFI